MFLIAGYNSVLHRGYLFGYNSQLSLLPDVDVGVFLALNGNDYTSLGRLLIHAFLMDLALDEEPWLNTTTICTFPEPWLAWPFAEELKQKLASLDDGQGHRFPKTDQRLRCQKFY